MPVESDDDRKAFLDADEFGVEAIYTPVATGLPSPEIQGQFDRPHLVRDFGADGPAISDAEPAFMCRSIDIPVGAAGGDCGDTLEVDGTTYRVLQLQPDGTGMTLITLGK